MRDQPLPETNLIRWAETLSGIAGTGLDVEVFSEAPRHEPWKDRRS